MHLFGLTNVNDQERITTTKKGSITSVQAIYVPADDLTDPAPATTFAHLDATTVLSRAVSELGIYPAVDPLDSNSRMLDRRIVGDEHYDCARATQKVLQDYKSLADIIAILGMDELSEDDKLTVARARKVPPFYFLPSYWTCFLCVVSVSTTLSCPLCCRWSASCRSHSLWLRCSQVREAVMSTLR